MPWCGCCARVASDVFMRNLTVTGGVAPARAYIEEWLPARR